MISINDACDYVIAKASEAGIGLNNLKLQKILYYCQAWHLAFGKGRLFDGHFQAWVHGPVSRTIYDRFALTKSLYSPLSSSDIREDFNAAAMSQEARELIDAVLNVYGQFTGDQLESMTHQEEPWKSARGDLPLHVRCENPIDEDVMAKFYASRLEK
ncbi:Panacea domain-containing protein [Desulfocurvibacter africanus]|uniref:Panacea domain-containing protein n=1 Tax=Desulfocurvibacter africanus TaxID=873 RepID=UPI000489DF64|nr:type II toxin-antitoxin system antitoxin SocA domain-containing protein [Desulfocurvibacter africanus]